LSSLSSSTRRAPSLPTSGLGCGVASFMRKYCHTYSGIVKLRGQLT
jgi:hypothetical protein